MNSKIDDHVWVEISLRCKDRLLCGCIYRSPTKEKALIVESTLKICEVISEAVQRHNSHILICGDFNYPEIDWENEYVEESSDTIKPFVDTIQISYLHQHILEPTRHRDGNEPGLLYLVFTNEEDMINDLKHNAGLGDSDHECLNFNLNCYGEVPKKKSMRNHFKADFTTIRDRLSKVNWISKLHGDFKTEYIEFCNILEEATEGCIPEYRKSTKRKKIYLTPEAIRKKDLKNKL